MQKRKLENFNAYERDSVRGLAHALDLWLTIGSQLYTAWIQKRNLSRCFSYKD